MLSTQRIVLAEVCQATEYLPLDSGARSARLEQRLVGRAIAIPMDTLSAAASSAGCGWHDFLCIHIIAGLWRERYKVPALAFYLPTSPVLVYFCSRSAQAQFWRACDWLQGHVGVSEMGRSYVKDEARPVAFWEPPATMVRLWPPADRGLLKGQSYMVDAGNLAGYYSYPYSQDDVEATAADPVQYSDYAIVPSDGAGEYTVGGRRYPYVNRFYELAWAP